MARKVGNYGEDLAADFLQKKGYQIMHRQYRTRFAEIDIIARHGEYIVFIEVKYRRNLLFGYPRESVGPVKQRKIKQCALMFMAIELRKEQDFRFDVIDIVDDSADGTFNITHIENAF